MNAPSVPHYVRHNRATRVPRNFVYLDSEARREVTKHGEVQTFRCAVAALDTRDTRAGRWVDHDPVSFDTVESLWIGINAVCETRSRVVLIAHNLAYDIRITDALAMLPLLGWHLAQHRFDTANVWCTWTRPGHTLVMCDSRSWVALPLERLGEMVNVPKLPLPDWNDTDEAWRARCTRDVVILREVWRRLVDWVRADDLGNWRPTGAGQSWSAYRHRFMSHRLLAHGDEDARDVERRSCWAGRCEVWQHGTARGGPFTEWDYRAAYARVGADCAVPIALARSGASLTVEKWAKLIERWSVLTEVEVTTEVPTLPALVGKGIAWPVGTFSTVVWENELALAIANGARVEIKRHWIYRRAPALRSFCEWVLGIVDGTAGARDPVVVAAAKHWSRTLIGRFGARWSEWEQIGLLPDPHVRLIRTLDGDTGERWDMLQVGNAIYREVELHDSPDAVVSILAWIMGECRVRLWQAMVTAGLDNVVYCDTDGLITNELGTERLRSADIEGLRVKGAWPTVIAHAPRQIEVSGQIRASGVPRRSTRTGPLAWSAEVWEQLDTALRFGHADRVEITERRITLNGRDNRREHYENGLTSPIRVQST